MDPYVLHLRSLLAKFICILMIASVGASSVHGYGTKEVYSDSDIDRFLKITVLPSKYRVFEICDSLDKNNCRPLRYKKYESDPRGYSEEEVENVSNQFTGNAFVKLVFGAAMVAGLAVAGGVILGAFANPEGMGDLLMLTFFTPGEADDLILMLVFGIFGAIKNVASFIAKGTADPLFVKLFSVGGTIGAGAGLLLRQKMDSIHASADFQSKKATVLAVDLEEVEADVGRLSLEELEVRVMKELLRVRGASK